MTLCLKSRRSFLKVPSRVTALSRTVPRVDHAAARVVASGVQFIVRRGGRFEERDVFTDIGYIPGCRRHQRRKTFALPPLQARRFLGKGDRVVHFQRAARGAGRASFPGAGGALS